MKFLFQLHKKQMSCANVIPGVIMSCLNLVSGFSTRVAMCVKFQDVVVLRCIAKVIF